MPRAHPLAAAEDRPSVLFVSAVAGMKGGAEAVLLDMLRSPFLRPSLAVPGPGELARRAAALGVPVHQFALGAAASVRRPLRPGKVVAALRDTVGMARRIAAIAEEAGAELVHANGLKVHAASLLARALGGQPVVIHMHDVPLSRAERAVWLALHTAAHHTIAASAICFTPAVIRSPATSVLRQGVDRPAAAVPRGLPLRPVIGCLGRFHPFKGTHLLLDWFEAVEDEFPQATLLLRGRADPEGQAYWQALQPRLTRLVAAGRCRVDAWRSGADDPFDGIDILAAPSVHPEVGPRVIMEAMLRGIPAIGFPAGGALEMIPHDGLGAHADSAAAFRAALARLLQPDAYARVSAAALGHARHAFGVDRFWRDLAAAHSSAMTRRARAGRASSPATPRLAKAPEP